MEITRKITKNSCPEGIPYLLEQAYLEEAADICGLNQEAKDVFLKEGAALRESRDATEHLWHCHWMMNNLSKIPEDTPGPDFFLSIAVLGKLPETMAYYKCRNIPLQILRNGASDLEIWAHDCHDKHDKWGNLHPYWVKNTFDCRLFRLGRLQFEPRAWHEDNKLIRNASGKLEFISLDAEESSPVIMKKGDMYLNVHIPALAPLDYEECRKSLADAKDFFKKYFPEMTLCCSRCCSWLLDRQLKHCLPQNSNILRFQTLFEDAPKADGKSDRQHRERIFGDPDIPIEKAPRNTSLQRNFIACLEKGIEFCYGQGIIMNDALI